MIHTTYVCPCGAEFDVEVTLPKGRDPQEAGSVDPSECDQCGEELNRQSFFEFCLDAERNG